MRNDMEEKRRQHHNRKVIEKMMRGEDLIEFDEMESWYPQRPIIKKDEKEIRRLYGSKEDDEEVKSNQPKSPLKLVSSQPLKSR